MTCLEVGLLGEFEVRRDDEPVSLGSHRTEALFAYLVMSSRAQPREHLVDLLWREAQSATAPGNLRVLFTNLRKTVGDVIQISRSSAQFRPPPDNPCQVDVHVFDERGRDALARPAHALRPDEVHDLRRALEVCRGDFLAHLELPEVTRFDDWVRGQRDRFRRQRVAILQQLTRAELAHHDIPHALRHARQLVDLEPLAEVGHQLVIRSLVDAGDMDGAVAQFDVLEHMLRREFGTTPSGHTRSLLVRPSGTWIAGTDHTGAPAGRAGASPQRPPRRAGRGRELPVPRAAGTGGPRRSRADERAPWSVFVDREQELRALHLAALEAVRGRGGAAVVRGSAGSGKSHLVRRAVRMLLEQEPELVALGGSCPGPGSGGGDLLVGGVVGQISGDADVPWLDGPMPPLVADRISSLAPAPPVVSAAGSFPVSAVAAAVRALAHARPVLLVVDNAQWAGPLTTALLSSLASDVRRRSLFLVCSSRPGGAGAPAASPEPGEAATDWLAARLRRVTGAPLVDLDAAAAPGGGDSGDVGAPRLFTRALLDSEPHDLDDAVVAAVARAGGDNPLLSVELLRDLARRKVLARSSRTWSLRGDVVWPVVPERIALVLDEVLVEVPAAARSLLEVAAALGDTFDVSGLVAATGADPWQVQLAVRTQLCDRQRLVVPVGEERFRFRATVLRQHLLARPDRARPVPPRSALLPG